MNGSNREAEPCVHCWHETGMGTSMGFGNRGMTDMKCCFCGVQGVREWFYESVPMEGHGPHATKQKLRHSVTRPLLGYRVISGNPTPPDASVSDAGVKP